MVLALAWLPLSVAHAAEGDADPRNWPTRPPSAHSGTLSRLRDTRQQLRGNIQKLLNSMNDWEAAMRKAAEDPSDPNLIAAKNRKHEFQKLGQTLAHDDAANAEKLITEGKGVIAEAKQFQARLGVWVEEAQRQVRLNGRIEAKARSVLEEVQRAQLRVDLERLAGQLEIADTLRKIQQNGELDLRGIDADIQTAVAGMSEDIQAIEGEREALQQAEALYAEGAKWTERGTESRYYRMVVTAAGQEVKQGAQQVRNNREMHMKLIRSGEDQEAATQSTSVRDKP